MIDLKIAPFYLSDEDIKWVETTISGMTIEEKIGQLFIHFIEDEMTQEGQQHLKHLLDQYHIGGIRYVSRNAECIYEQNAFMQANSKLPLFVAANCDNGGDGACKGGTYIATAAQAGATSDEETAYHVGVVSGREAAAIGCNWSFNPVSDVIFNWRNTIVNIRSFGNQPSEVIKHAKAYIKGLRESGLAACAKHFPGDGVEDRDQHLIMGVNDFSCERWDETFGEVYSKLIEEGLQTIMVGHIALPEYSRKLVPGIAEEDIKPATLAPELLQGLLREKLGFNGLLVTDASHMVGLVASASRKELVPGTIAAGCDMFLFFRNPEEDFNYMLEGYKNGIITDKRLEEALTRILGLKASLGLHKKQEAKTLIPPKEGLKVIGQEEHLTWAKQAADKGITLVKDTQKLLPIDPKIRKKAKVFMLSTPPVSIAYEEDPAKKLVKEELEAAGFIVDMHDSFYDLELKYGASKESKDKIHHLCKIEDFKKQYDVVFVFVNVRGYAQENNVRIKWSSDHSNELPWYVQEVPTVCVSLNYTTHLFDLPMMKTYINAYAANRNCIKAAIDKITGKSPFLGRHNETVFCAKWDTRL